MKRTLIATVALTFVLAGLAAGQSADEDYLKAMQLADNCAKVQALDAYITKYGGQGTTNEHWAYAYYCLTPCSSRPPVKAAEYGEKALGMPGLDGQTKLAIMATLPTLYHSAGQAAKADAAARKLIDYGKGLGDAKTGAKLQAGGYLLMGQFAEKAGDFGKAAENYITAYGILKDPSISKQLNGLAATLIRTASSPKPSRSSASSTPPTRGRRAPRSLARPSTSRARSPRLWPSTRKATPSRRPRPWP
jgi:hypothetical protein